MSDEQRKKYDSDFKIGTIRLILNGKPIAEVASDLDLNPSMLARWKREYLKDQAASFPGKGKLRPEDEKIRQLERQLRDVTEERDILKKAVAIFSKQPK
ncbi:MAG TPA: transposase [bacterium]|nr:transposase [bacterium]